MRSGHETGVWKDNTLGSKNNTLHYWGPKIIPGGVMAGRRHWLGGVIGWEALCLDIGSPILSSSSRPWGSNLSLSKALPY